MLIRAAHAADSAACAAVYAPYVLETAVSFELDPPGAAEMARRVARAHAWLVAEDAGRVIGYAYGARFREREAYRFACEVSVYLEPGRRRTGAGRALYEALLARLTELGLRTAFAGMTLPNDASVGLHAALGFETVGVLRAVGWKDGRWHDVQWMQRALGDGADRPPSGQTDVRSPAGLDGPRAAAR